MTSADEHRGGGNVLLTTVAEAEQLVALALLAFPQGGPPLWAHQRHMDTILKSLTSCRLLLTRGRLSAG